MRTSYGPSEMWVLEHPETGEPWWVFEDTETMIAFIEQDNQLKKLKGSLEWYKVQLITKEDLEL